ncbi:MAG TPA: M23 family metallopeptidase [Terracidiphilus sp.]|nr:M23 family metallopeptidase [Terracidiphilus sp.]
MRRFRPSILRLVAPLLVLLSIPALPITAAFAQAPASALTGSPEVKNLFWQPNQIQQGSPAFFTLELSGPAARVTATWIGKQVTFFKSDKPHVWYALAGADLETQAGDHELRITAVMAGGHTAHAAESIAVGAANFGTGTANVAEQYVQPNAEEQKVIERDEVLKKHAYAQDVRRPLWSGNFIKPVAAESTPSFGETRLLNEEKTSRHTGTDFPVKEGSPVHVSNSGVVLLARDLYYEGNCVIVDHGDRLFTVYMHLSKMNVHPGEHLRKGGLIGLSGATGRVTGPHFHMGVRWNGAWLDPVQLLGLTLPDRTRAGKK